MYDPSPEYKNNAVYAFSHGGETRLIEGSKGQILRTIKDLDKKYEIEGLNASVNGAALGLLHIFKRFPETRGEIKNIVSGGFKLPWPRQVGRT